MTMFYLKNKIDGGVIDILASSLDAARQIAAEFLGGKLEDYVERFN